jgi:hypothetical protein
MHFKHIRLLGLQYLVIELVSHLASDDELLIEDMKHAPDDELLITIRCRKYDVQKIFESVCENWPIFNKIPSLLID